MLDTDIFSEMSKGMNPNVTTNAALYRQVFPRFTISVVTFLEVVRGYTKKQSLRQLQNFLMLIASEEVIDFDRDDAELAGLIYGELERVGRPIGLADTMIAATALNRGLDLVTGNTTHFERVRQLGHPLTLVNWR